MKKPFLAALLFLFAGLGFFAAYQVRQHWSAQETVRVPEVVIVVRLVVKKLHGFQAPSGGRYIDMGKRTWKRTRAQGVQLARMASNEDSRALRGKPNGTEGRITIDHRLIALVIWNRRNAKSTFRGWYDVMKWLSPHIGRAKQAKRHRHKVNAYLPSEGSNPPPDWIDCRSVKKKKRCDGDWRVHGPFWVEFRERIVDFWLNTDFSWLSRRLGVVPIQWGDSQDIVRYLKRRPDHCVLAIGDHNFFVARPGNGCELGDAATVAARKGKRP